MQIKFGRIQHSKKQFGDFLAATRRKKKILQGELADQVGITQASLSRIESGKTAVTIQRVAMFCEALQVQMSIEFDEVGGVVFLIKQRTTKEGLTVKELKEFLDEFDNELIVSLESGGGTFSTHIEEIEQQNENLVFKFSC